MIGKSLTAEGLGTALGVRSKVSSGGRNQMPYWSTNWRGNMNAKTPLIQLFHARPRSAFAAEEFFTVEDLGGVIPVPGDLIVVPNANEPDPTKRDLYEVLHRYYLPAQDGTSPRIALVVQVRKGRQDEVNIL